MQSAINLESYTIHLEGHLVKVSGCEICIRRGSELEIDMGLDLPDLISVILHRITTVNNPFDERMKIVIGKKGLWILRVCADRKKY